MALMQDARVKTGITSNKNMQSNDDTKDSTDSKNKDDEEDKTENDNVRNIQKRKGSPQKVTTKKKRRQTDLYFT